MTDHTLDALYTATVTLVDRTSLRYASDRVRACMRVANTEGAYEKLRFMAHILADARVIDSIVEM